MTFSRKQILLLTLFCLRSLVTEAQTSSPAVNAAGGTNERIERVENCLPAPVAVKGEESICTGLVKRMAQLHVPGLSIAVVHHGAVEWARGYGVASVGGGAVTPATLFQAGSISKPIAAMSALHMVQDGKLTLDGDVNAKLTTWKVPASAAAVTLRELLTHTAGFTVHGFPGYAASDPLPTLVQVLNGEKPANTGPIRLESVPGNRWNYSGGGYTVMQQMLVDVSGKAFPDLLRESVLGPVGMTHSTYQQPLPEALRGSAATPYKLNGEVVAGGAHTYPEMAAAGLWTTPSDLGLYLLEVQRSLHGEAHHVLSQEMTKQMLKAGKGSWGLGLEIGGAAANPYFTHGGVNDGFESLMVGYEQGGEGAVVMTNVRGGSRIAAEVMRSIAAAYEWPDFKPSVRTMVKVEAKTAAQYVGTYQISPTFNLTFTLEGDQMMTQATGQPKFPMFSESATRFFLKNVDAEVEFHVDEMGFVNSATLYQNGHQTEALKIK